MWPLACAWECLCRSSFFLCKIKIILLYVSHRQLLVSQWLANTYTFLCKLESTLQQNTSSIYRGLLSSLIVLISLCCGSHVSPPSSTVLRQWHARPVRRRTGLQQAVCARVCVLSAFYYFLWLRCSDSTGLDSW